MTVDKPPEQQTLSDSEFEELCKSDRFKAFKVKSLDMAKLMWVSGLSAGDAGRQLNMSKQNASALAQRLEAARASVPKGWVKLDIYVPPELAQKVSEWLETYLSSIGRK
jgi:hypothetical protein